MNRFPAENEAFREPMLTFFEACCAATDRILRAFAIALQLPDDFFTPRHNQRCNTLWLLHYPPVVQTPKPDQVRAGEHTDYGSITLLFQDQVGGLEVQTADGNWLLAPCIPGAIVVNTGDLMQRWTNHVFCSTRHRVGCQTTIAWANPAIPLLSFAIPTMTLKLRVCQAAKVQPILHSIHRFRRETTC